MDKAAGTVVLGKTEGNVGERAGIVFAIHERRTWSQEMSGLLPLKTSSGVKKPRV